MHSAIGNMKQIGLTVEEASRLIHMSEANIRRLCENHIIPAVRVGETNKWRISYVLFDTVKKGSAIKLLEHRDM